MKRIFLQLAIGLTIFGAGRLAAQTTGVVGAKAPETNATPAAVVATNLPPGNAASTNGVAASPASTSTTNEAAPRMDARYFRLISDRNIFDQTRRPQIIRTINTNPPPRIDSFTLTGVGLDNNQGAAMFDSTSSLYRKTLFAGDTIAGYRIAEITPDLDAIKLAASSNQVVTMRVGMQMRRSNNGPWLLASRALNVTLPPVEGDAEKSDAPVGATNAAIGDAAANDIIKRLMEKRARGE
jgi:hypothetical protein